MRFLKKVERTSWDTPPHTHTHMSRESFFGAQRRCVEQRDSGPFRLPVQTRHRYGSLGFEASGAPSIASLISCEPMCWGIGKAMEMGKQVEPQKKGEPEVVPVRP